MTNDYYGTKRVTAWPEVRGSSELGADDIEGYAVKYADGYTSWSPKDVFEAAYQPLDALSFGHAVAALKEGRRVARGGWNGRGMFLFFCPATLTPDGNTGLLIRCEAYLVMKTVQNSLVPWLASQTDVLADDWTIVE